MPILVDSLSVWDISFRWAGYDPRKFYFRVPLEVENNYRTLIGAILAAEIDCESILLEKRKYSPDEKQLSVYFWIDDIYACIWGKRFDKALLKWALIDRFSFKLWCERMNVPLPQFWFPKGWNLEYDLPENEISPGHWYIRKDWSEEQLKDYVQTVKANESKPAQLENPSEAKMRPNQEARIACQQIAKKIWKDDPTRTIASVIKDPLIQEYGGAKHFVDDTIRAWINVVAPTEIRERKGRPRKKGDKD